MVDSKLKRLIIITTMIGAFWTALIVTSANVALPTIGREFNASPYMLSWIISSSLLATAMFVIPIGKLSDIYGRKKTMFVGTVILTITSLLCGLSNSITLLIVFRSIQGIGGAMLTTTVLSIVTSAFDPGERGKALGISVACTYIGLSTGPFISGLIVHNFNWRGIFFFSIPIGLILLLLISKIDQEWKELDSKKIDYIGSVIYAVAIITMIWGLSNLNKTVYARYSLLAGIITLCFFVWFEFKTDSPLLDLRTMKSNKVLVFSSLAAFINYSSTFAISYMMSLYLQSIKGLNPQTAGLILLVQPSFQAIFSPVAGVLSDRIDPQYVSSTGMALIAVSLLLLSLIGVNTPLFLIIMLLGIIGTGFALFSSPNVNSVMSSVAKHEYGVASGILSTARTVGQSFSMAMTALITSLYLGSKMITPETSGLFIQSFKVTFILFSILCLFGIAASLARGKRVDVKANEASN